MVRGPLRPKTPGPESLLDISAKPREFVFPGLPRVEEDRGVMGSVLKSCIIALYWEERFERRYGFRRRVTCRLKKKGCGGTGIGEFHPRPCDATGCADPQRSRVFG